MSIQRLTERIVAPFAGSKVNREAGTIDDVLICGTESANGRDYPVSVFKRDFAKYEGKPVNCDHSREATVARRCGWFANVRPGADGRPRGTLHLLRSHPVFEQVMEAAERNPALFGFSHVAMCDTRRGSNGREVVEAIREVESIDLVAQPATTKGLFEGRHVPQISLNTFVERFGPKWGAKKWADATRLCEDLGAMGDTTVMDEPPAEATEGDLKSGLMAALTPLLEEAFESGNSDKAVSALKDFIKLHAKHTGKAEPKEEPAAEEGKGAAGIAILEALAVCKAVGFTGYSTDELEAIAAYKPEGRKALAESYKRLQGAGAGAGGAETPISAPRGQTKEAKGSEPARVTWDS